MNKDHLKKILAAQVKESAKLGRVDEIRELLLQMLQLFPDDEETKAELSRLNRGVRLKMAQSNKEIPAPPADPEVLPPNEVAQIKEKVFKLIHQHEGDKERIRHSTRPRLRRRQRYIDTYLRKQQIHWTVQEREDIQEFQQEINDELERRNRERRIIFNTCCTLSIIAFCSLLVFILYKSATLADIRLRDALLHQNKTDVQLAIEKAKRPLYLYLCPELAISIHTAQEWMENQQSSYKLIYQLEDGTRDISSLNPGEYKAIQQLQQSTDFNDHVLFNRWQIFKQSQLSEQEKQKVELLTKLIAAIPEEHIPSDDLEQDKEKLLEEQSALQSCLDNFKNHQKTLGLGKDYTIKLDWRLKKIESQLKDIEELKQLATNAQAASSYKQYLEILQQLKGNNYPLSKNIAQLTSKLPSLEQLNALMRYTSTDESSELLKALEATLLNDEASFNPQFPANAYQVETMGQIFRDRSLNTPLYQLTSKLDGTAWLSELAPTETDNHIILTRSPMDPLHITGSTRGLKIKKQLGMELKRISALPLLEACDIQADNFFSETQLPNKLTAVVQYQNANYPILAQAFIYQQILRTMELHEWPKMMGFTFSSQLREDQKSFKRLVKSCGFELDGESWLRVGPQYQTAEAKFKEWFKKNQLHDYGLDIKRVLRRVLFVRIRFAGYINKEGQTVLCNPIPDQTPVWYVGKDQQDLQVGSIKDLQEAAPYSPILYSDPLEKESEQ